MLRRAIYTSISSTGELPSPFLSWSATGAQYPCERSVVRYCSLFQTLKTAVHSCLRILFPAEERDSCVSHLLSALASCCTVRVHHHSQLLFGARVHRINQVLICSREVRLPSPFTGRRRWHIRHINLEQNYMETILMTESFTGWSHYQFVVYCLKMGLSISLKQELKPIP